MVCLFSGTPRSGKSLDSIRYIISRSRRGKPVITNFGCKLDKYKKANYAYCPNECLTPSFLIRYAQEYWGHQRICENEILLVIDEAQLLFPSIGTKTKNRMEWLRFFTLHGKLGYHIILIAQNDRMIDRQIRGVIEYDYIHRKLNNFGARGLLLRLVTLGKQYVVIQRWYPNKETISKEFFNGHKGLYSIYDSYVLFSTDGHKKIEDSRENLPESSTADEKTTKQCKAVILLRSVCLVYHTSLGLSMAGMSVLAVGPIHKDPPSLEMFFSSSQVQRRLLSSLTNYCASTVRLGLPVLIGNARARASNATLMHPI